MAEALAETHNLHVWARRPETLAGFADKGAHLMDSAQSVARAVDFLCLCLPDDAELQALLFNGGLADALPNGGTVINHATGDPRAAAANANRLAPIGLRYLDAPVSGGRPAAEARNLTCFVGGDADTLHLCEPVLSCHSSAIRLMGGPGAGQMTKILNNALTVSNLRNLVEVFGLAAQAGVDLSSLQAALATSSGGSFMARAIGKQDNPSNAAHIASLNRKDVQEFAAAMEQLGLNPERIVDWAMGAPAALPDLVAQLGTLQDT